MLTITIPGEPVAQGRGRAVRIGAGVRVIDPAKSRSWKGVAAVFMQQGRNAAGVFAPAFGLVLRPEIAALSMSGSSLIVAVNAGLDAETYKKLSAIAPTIAQSGGEAFFEPWKDQATAVATAVFKKDEMGRLIDAVDAKFAAAGQANPSFRDRTAVLLEGRFTGDAVTATVGGWRTDFLSALGLAVPESVKGLQASGQAAIPRAELAAAVDSADVLIWCTDSDAEQAALQADPTVADLRATTMKRNVFTPAELSAAIAFASPLSYPLVADQLPPLLARTLS